MPPGLSVAEDTMTYLPLSERPWFWWKIAILMGSLTPWLYKDSKFILSNIKMSHLNKKGMCKTRLEWIEGIIFLPLLKTKELRRFQDWSKTVVYRLLCPKNKTLIQKAHTRRAKTPHLAISRNATSGKVKYLLVTAPVAALPSLSSHSTFSSV